MRVCVYPGSFDPFTVAHADIVQRASKLFDYCYVGVLINEKKKPRFSAKERAEMINTAIMEMGIQNASAIAFSGLLVDFAKKNGACATIRGMRNTSDFEAESTMFELNSLLCPEIETVVLLSKPQHRMISSTAVKEIIDFGGAFSEFVPKCVADRIMKGETE